MKHDAEGVKRGFQSDVLIGSSHVSHIELPVWFRPAKFFVVLLFFWHESGVEFVKFVLPSQGSSISPMETWSLQDKGSEPLM